MLTLVNLLNEDDLARRQHRTDGGPFFFVFKTTPHHFQMPALKTNMSKPNPIYKQKKPQSSFEDWGFFCLA